MIFDDYSGFRHSAYFFKNFLRIIAVVNHIVRHAYVPRMVGERYSFPIVIVYVYGCAWYSFNVYAFDVYIWAEKKDTCCEATISATNIKHGGILWNHFGHLPNERSKTILTQNSTMYSR